MKKGHNKVTFKPYTMDQPALMRSPAKASNLSGHAVQSAERSDAGENIIYQLDGMGTTALVFR